MTPFGNMQKTLSGLIIELEENQVIFSGRPPGVIGKLLLGIE